LGEKPIELPMAHPVREAVRRGIDPVFAQDRGRTIGKARTQRRVLPQPRDKLRHRQRLALRGESERGIRSAQQRREQTGSRFEKGADGDRHDQSPCRY
jgi:hypothetical protein